MRLGLKLVFLIAALVFVLLKNQHISAPEPGPAEERADKSEISFYDGYYHDAFNDFSLKQPGNDWKFSPAHRSRNLIKLDIAHKSGKYGLQVRVHEKRGRDFNRFIADYIKRFKSDMNDPELISQNDFSGKNILGKAISFDGRERNGYFLKSYVFSGKRFYYALQSGCPYVHKNELEPELDKIAASFSTK